MVGGLQESNAWKASVGRAVKRRPHETATDLSILHLRVHRDRPQPRDGRPLIKKIAADDDASQFGDDAKEPRMRE